MDETRWLAAATPLHLLGYARRELRATRTKSGRRKLRLFGCACGRRVWPALRPDQRAVIEAAERAADGLATLAEVERAWAATHRWVLPTVVGAIRGFVWRVLGRQVEPEPVETPPAQPPSVGRLLVRIARREAWATVHACRAAAAADLNAIRGNKPAAEKRIQADLARCLFGNPFRPTTFDPRWRTSTAVGLARAVYDEHAFDRLPILADALEEAGCDDEPMLKHCREAAVHARGCWVVDRVLGNARRFLVGVDPAFPDPPLGAKRKRVDDLATLRARSRPVPSARRGHRKTAPWRSRLYNSTMWHPRTKLIPWDDLLAVREQRAATAGSSSGPTAPSTCSTPATSAAFRRPARWATCSWSG